jgi:hypothetical protein
MSDPLAKPKTSLKLVSGIAQVEIEIARSRQMKTRTILKENTTLEWHESFLLENRTMTRREDHP